MKRYVMLALCASAFTGLLAAAEPALVMPQLEKPTKQAEEGDPLHEKYEAAWTRYEEAVAMVNETVSVALDNLFNKAADAGNLDLADMWDRKKKLFLDAGAVTWPSDGKAKVEWRKAYPSTDFPDDFTDVIATAQAGFTKAVATLKEDYESLVKDYTKDRNLARAKALRDELTGLVGKPVTQVRRPTTVEKKPEPKPESKPVPSVVGMWNGEGGWANEFLEDMTASNLNPQGQVDTIGVWKDEGPGQYSARLGQWYWQILVKGDEMQVVRYLNGELKGKGTLRRRR